MPSEPSEQRKARQRALRYYKGLDPKTGERLVDEANVRMLANKLKALYKSGELGTYKAFFHSLGVAAATSSKFDDRLTHFLNAANTPNTPERSAFNVRFFDEKDYTRIVEALFERRLWYPENFLHHPPKSGDAEAPPDSRRREPHHLQHFFFPDPAFHAVGYFIGMNRSADGTVSHHDTDHLRTYFAGDFNVYRHSTIDLGNVLVGNLSISWDPDTRAIVTEENYAIPTLGRTFDLDGYLFSYARRYRLLSRHRDSRNPQVIYIDDVVPDNSGIAQRLYGVVVDIEDNGRLYVTRVAILRAATKKEKERVRTAPLAEIPECAQIQLTYAPQTLGNYIFRF